jgi:hypothetical protein
MFNDIPTNEMRGAIFTDLISSMMSDALKTYHDEHQANMVALTDDRVKRAIETLSMDNLDAQVKTIVENWWENDTDVEKMIESAIDSACSYGEIDSAIDRAIENIDFQDAFNDCTLDNDSAYVSRETFDELKESVEELKAELVAVQAVYSALVIIKANLQN